MANGRVVDGSLRQGLDKKGVYSPNIHQCWLQVGTWLLREPISLPGQSPFLAEQPTLGRHAEQ